MTKKILSIFAALGLLLVIIVAAIFIFGGRKSGSSDGEAAPSISRSELENILLLSKATFGYPKMMDEHARADDARLTDANEFEVLVTLINIDSKKTGYAAELEKMKATLPASACEKKSVKFLLYKGITTRLSFKSNDGLDLFSYVLKPGICP